MPLEFRRPPIRPLPGLVVIWSLGAWRSGRGCQPLPPDAGRLDVRASVPAPGRAAVDPGADPAGLTARARPKARPDRRAANLQRLGLTPLPLTSGTYVCFREI